MEVLYDNKKVEEICNDYEKARKFFGGDKQLAMSLISRINSLKAAEVINDIIVQRQMRFHNLSNFGKGKNLKGLCAIDVKTVREKWRILLKPLDDNKEEYLDFDIDKISKVVKIVMIKEVSNHYE